MGSMLLPRIKQIKILFLIFLTVSLSLSCSNSQTLRCTRVVDGDTIILSNGETVRLIGVDTPETKHPRKPVEYYAKETSAFTPLERKPRHLQQYEKSSKFGEV